MAKNNKKRVSTPRRHEAKPSVKKSTGNKVTKRVAAKKKQLKATIPFEPEQRILLIGEGDFSFARSLVEQHGCCDITATCLDSEDELFAKYEPQGKQNVGYLIEEGQTVLYQVDATNLQKQKVLRQAEKFDCILFNFPHVGGKSTDVNRQVRFNQELLFKFFQSASSLLAHSGSIVVTLFEGEPYTLWNIRDLARSSNLMVERSFAFLASAYPGYSHARTLGNIEGGGGWKGEHRDSRSYVFKSKNEVSASILEKRKKSRNNDSDGDEEG